MLNENFKNGSEFKGLESVIEQISIRLLTKKTINDTIIIELNDKMDLIFELIKNDEFVSKELVNMLLKFYIRAHTEVDYLKVKDKNSELLIAHLQSNLQKLFKIDK